ncbi:hypothetical protein MWG07_11915 [Fusobacterium necrophorum]|uniref:Uncharacterized protein n=2 Tax=Fusobacterium necrophorum TaxID=859 RepID=A0AAW6WE09_9FUSO|nr:hypothetical protein [Fusobacterium necrophorum]MDK4512956.1 hypothetical protein [Fusobacterium necrophorum]
MYSDTERGEKMTKSRAEYFKERRKKLKDFGVLVDREKLEKLEERLKSENKTKTFWLNEKIDEELKK